MTTGPRAKKGPVLIAEIIAAISRSLGRESAKQEKVFSLWQKVAGKKKGTHTKVSAFEQGVLTILVDSSSVLYELSLEKGGLLQKLQRELGEEKLKDIRFQIGL